MPWDTIRPAIKPASDPFKPFLAQLKADHDTRSAKDAEFVFIRDKLALAKKLMEEKPSASTKRIAVHSTPASRISNWCWKTPAARPG